MPSPLYSQLQKSGGGRSLIEQAMEFKKNFVGNPQQIIQQMLNNGKLTQTQLNQYANKANELYRQMKDMF